VNNVEWPERYELGTGVEWGIGVECGRKKIPHYFHAAMGMGRSLV